MKLMKGLLAATVSAAGLMAVNGASAAVVLNITQTGTNVTAVASGTLNLTGLTAGSVVSSPAGIAPLRGFIGFGTSDGLRSYTGLTGAGGFGTSDTFTSATSTGTVFAFNATSFGVPTIFLPTTFASGGLIAATDTFAGATLASLGLTAGSYVYRSASDTFTINVGAGTPAVPEPATWAMMLFGFGGIGFAMRRKSKVRTTVSFA